MVTLRYNHLSLFCLVGMVISLVALFFGVDVSCFVFGFGLGAIGFQSVRGVWQAGYSYGAFLLVTGTLQEMFWSYEFPGLSYVMVGLGLLFVLLQTIEFFFPRKKLFDLK